MNQQHAPRFLVEQLFVPAPGEEFDFVAEDHRGALGIFSTAGSGKLPVQPDGWTKATRELIEYIHSMPSSGRAIGRSPRTTTGNYADFYRYSERGFYAFDWRLNNGPYERLSMPEVEAPISGLPSELRWVVVSLNWIEFNAMPNFSFDEVEAL
ncbi:MAG TPA: hypothetical protein VHO01_07885 [Jatrophihabitans sp.]|nr:hypothetical protein [Jatrophihabitans sp.]